MSSYKIHYQNRDYSCHDNETLLEALIRQGVETSFSCQKGSCHICMMQCTYGEIPENSQRGLKTNYIEKGYFLPCSCTPTSDMSVINIDSSCLYSPAIIHKKQILSKDVCRLTIEPGVEFNYAPGQYINIRRLSDGVARSYSLVSHPDDYFIELHIKKMRNGTLSSWIFDELDAGDEIEFQGPMGDSVYSQVRNKNAALIFIGKGTGIAPVYGVALDAIKNSHTGNINIYHDGQSKDDIYLHEALISLDKENANTTYTACVESVEQPYYSPHNVFDLLEVEIDSISDPVVFIAGSPTFIDSMKAMLKHHKIPTNAIHADSFDYQDLRSGKPTIPVDLGRRGSDPEAIIQHTTARQLLSKDDEMWCALEKGKKLKQILDDFYSQVYEDVKLSGFFMNSTIQRSSEKQYLFMRQIFTGEKVYFGDRPKNAHHWMVISDELFNYREALLSDCLKKHGLQEHLIQRWLNINESFRLDIVKQAPVPKVINGVEMPLNGYEVLKIDEGTICDGCHEAIEKGEMVRYHLRLGLTYCHRCMESKISHRAV